MMVKKVAVSYEQSGKIRMQDSTVSLSWSRIAPIDQGCLLTGLTSEPKCKVEDGNSATRIKND
jgi:hypothetical protein